MKRILIILALFLIGCTGGSPPKDVDIYVGTEGVVLTIPETQRITKIVEDSELYSPLELENRGTADLDKTRYGYLTINYDNYYLSSIRELTIPIDGSAGAWATVQVTDNTKIQVYPAMILLNGKSNDYPVGEKLLLDFSYKVNKLQGQMESPETTIIYTLCYPYTTTFTKEVCIDADPFSTDKRAKVCTAQNLVYGEGQGAPIAVTRVEPLMSKSGQTIKPTFRVFIRNEGEGSVLDYDGKTATPIYQLCQAASIDHLDWNKVHVAADLTGTPLECTPETVYLRTDEDSYTVCKFKDQDLEVPSSNYKANLNVALSYIYIQSAAHQVEIIRG